MPLMRPVSELQRNISSIYELCHSSGEPVYITRNGQADLVVMDARAFKERDTLQKSIYEREKRLHDSIMNSWEQAKSGQLNSLSQVRGQRDKNRHEDIEAADDGER